MIRGLMFCAHILQKEVPWCEEIYLLLFLSGS